MFISSVLMLLLYVSSYDCRRVRDAARAQRLMFMLYMCPHTIAGEFATLLELEAHGWCLVRSTSGRRGYFPQSYIAPTSPPPPQSVTPPPPLCGIQPLTSSERASEICPAPPRCGQARVQFLRSGSRWSLGLPTETSIQKAYMHLIANAKRHIYIENQFFVTSCGEMEEVVEGHAPGGGGGGSRQASAGADDELKSGAQQGVQVKNRIGREHATYADVC